MQLCCDPYQLEPGNNTAAVKYVLTWETSHSLVQQKILQTHRALSSSICPKTNDKQLTGSCYRLQQWPSNDKKLSVKSPKDQH